MNRYKQHMNKILLNCVLPKQAVKNPVSFTAYMSYEERKFYLFLLRTCMLKPHNVSYSLALKSSTLQKVKSLRDKGLVIFVIDKDRLKIYPLKYSES